MDGVHDLGGVAGFGPVRTAGSDEVASEDWELRAHALALQAAGESLRPWIEGLPPETYLAAPYFARWLLAIEELLFRRGAIHPDELVRYRDEIARGVRVVPRAESAELTALMSELMSAEQRLPRLAEARFAVGDRVCVRREHSSEGVNRCPRYVRGAVGLVERICGPELPLDRPKGASAETVYTVAFRSTELWGTGEEPAFTVHVDLTEHYLTGADHD
ncbi:SH3-like domain-containing protein [Streptomyces sp. NPDC056159]|uniref:SH3-like domain-containing protein n=1 Tax=unclassified Streptomyces TaxID=2593676 RepID=UPI003435C113